MSSVFGQIELKLEKGVTTVTLDHAVLLPNFFIPAVIMHESIINGVRTWSNDIHFSEFTVNDLLFLYDDPAAKAIELRALEDDKYLFSPFTMMWSKYVLITSVIIKPVEPNSEYDIAYISMIAADPGTLGAYLLNRQGEKLKDRSGQYIRRKIRGVE